MPIRSSKMGKRRKYRHKDIKKIGKIKEVEKKEDDYVMVDIDKLIEETDKIIKKSKDRRNKK